MCCSCSFFLEQEAKFSPLLWSRTIRTSKSSVFVMCNLKLVFVRFVMGSSEKRSKDVLSDIPTFSGENLQKNLKVIQNRFVWFITTTLFFFFKQNSFDSCFDRVVSCLQPDVSVHHRWSPCGDYWIHGVDWFCVLLCGDVDHICWTHG